MIKPWRALETAVVKVQQWEVGICEGSGYHGRTVAKIYQPSAERALELAKEVAEALNRWRRVKEIMEGKFDEDKMFKDMLKAAGYK